jgi:hypothetical protein
LSLVYPLNRISSRCQHCLHWSTCGRADPWPQPLGAEVGIGGGTRRWICTRSLTSQIYGGGGGRYLNPAATPHPRWGPGL